MTRKDYVAIAAAFYSRAEMARSIQGAASRLTHYREIADSVADVMGCDNPRFDRARFLRACGVYDPEMKRARAALKAGAY